MTVLGYCLFDGTANMKSFKGFPHVNVRALFGARRVQCITVARKLPTGLWYIKEYKRWNARSNFKLLRRWTSYHFMSY